MYGGGFGDNFGVIVGDVEALGMDHPRWANITVFISSSRRASIST